MSRMLAILIAVAALAAGILGQADPWSLQTKGTFPDQQVLAHRDSPYTHVTWVASTTDNSAELRFYDRVEGGVCLLPAWGDLAGHGVPHLAMPPGFPTQEPPAGPTWQGPKPNPGSLTHTRYIALYPTAILLNQQLLSAVGGDWRATKPRILIVGLGSGVGAAILAHHLPGAHITVVDIDQVVIDMVRDHFPLLRWLEQEGRLELVKRDARQYIARPQVRRDPSPYDLIILDAYTAGSTIPPHLMTLEFYKECKDALAPGGMLLSNIIGSYTGKQHRILGGAIRSMRAAGLEHVLNFPVHLWHAGDFDSRETRNNMVLAAAEPFLGPGREANWQRLEAIANGTDLYRELPLGRFVTRRMGLYVYQRTADSGLEFLSSSIDPATLPAGPEREQLLGGLAAMLRKAVTPGRLTLDERNSDLLKLARRLVLSGSGPVPAGWRLDDSFAQLGYTEIDWVEQARSSLRQSVSLAAAGGAIRQHGGEALVGPLEGQRKGAMLTWTITDPPLFTDAQPNADIMNY